MPRFPIIMPQLGESIAEATITRILVQPGDTVAADQEVLEVETNKATMSVVSPCSGVVIEVPAELHQAYPVEATLIWLELTPEESARRGLDGHAQKRMPTLGSAATNYGAAEETPGKRQVEPRVRGLPVPANAVGASYMSPRMKARMNELGLHAADLAGVAGSGAAGRVTVEDFEKFLAQLDRNKLTPASSMRIAVADAMRRSWTRPLATVGLAVNLDPMLAHRRTQDPKPGPTLYALRALALALAENSAPAGRLVGAHIVHPPAIDIGFAVEADDGVLVPVLRGADRYSLKALAARYDDLVSLARQRRLPPEATGGSIATVTNFGSFGLTWATPIPLPEQTLVLGLGAGRPAPRWDERQERFLPATEAQMTLSFDHRVLDGGAAGRLLTRVSTLLSEPERL